MSKYFIFNSSLFGLLLIFAVSPLFSQTSYSLETEIVVQVATGEELPFWMYSNHRGRISAETNVLGLATGKMQHRFRNEGVLEFGAGGVVHDGFQNRIDPDELYVEYRNQWFYITAGMKQRAELYNGLSATNENILWSLNARPLPGLEIGTSAPVFFLPNFAFEVRWAEYLMEKDRHVPRARVHHKSLHLVFQPNEDWTFKAGIQHFAQWGGTSPDWGKQPAGFTDYLRIISGRAGGETALQGDIENNLGNHLGSWEVFATRNFRDHSFTFIYNNIFEDGSGSRLANFPDGRYGVFWENKEKQALINSVLYEFYYTRHQSYDVNRWGADNYLNHIMTYNSGWSFHEQVLGAPFFLYDRQQDLIINNKFLTHHLGMGGDMGTYYNPFPYRLLISYRHNEGSYYQDQYPSHREPHIVSTYLTTRLLNGDFDFNTPHLMLDFILAADFNTLSAPNFGAGISLIYSLAN